MEHVSLLALLIFLAAILYSSVGHAGASGYLAAMALMSIPPDVMRPTALSSEYPRGIHCDGAVRSRRLFFVEGFLAVRNCLDSLFVPRWRDHFARTLLQSRRGNRAPVRCRSADSSHGQESSEDGDGGALPGRLIAGGGIGLLAGLTGTGGGIFLSPLLLLAGWAEVRVCAGVSAAFVLVNSVAGLAGKPSSVHDLPPQFAYLAVAAGARRNHRLRTRQPTPRARP